MATATRKSVTTGFKSQRFYTIPWPFTGTDTVDVPSVTTVLDLLAKPALIQWAANTAIDATFDLLTAPGATQDMDAIRVRAKAEWRAVAKKAADHGTRIHELADLFLAGRPEQDMGAEPEAVVNGYLAFLDWAESSGFVSVAGEQTVFSITHRYAGTLDQIGTMAGRGRVIVDIKSCGKVPAAPYREVELQLEAYGRAHYEMTGERVDGYVVCYLGRETGDFRAFDIQPSKAAFEAFINLRQAWSWMNGGK